MAMPATNPARAETDGERFVIPPVSWDAYVAFNDRMSP
jgi:hypothetical protein